MLKKQKCTGLQGTTGKDHGSHSGDKSETRKCGEIKQLSTKYDLFNMNKKVKLAASAVHNNKNKEILYNKYGVIHTSIQRKT